ncbi:MAG: hypothetical protein KBD73_02890 [Candidatus Magasanikbacteria bacterium]|nr:hypothetical protein [Candidatus Magasanikbacteria bacterium]
MKNEFPRIHDTLEVITEGKEGVDLPQKETLLDERLAYLREFEKKMTEDKDILPSESIEDTIKKIEAKGQSYLVLRDVLERIQRETGYLDEWVETGLFFEIINARLEDPEYMGAKVKWGRKKIEGKGNYEGKMINMIRVINKKATINIKAAEPPQPDEILSDLAHKGDIPKVLKTLQHEFVHGTQDFNSLGDYIENVKKNAKDRRPGAVPLSDMQEGQAFRAANHPIDKKSADDLTNHIVSRRRSKNNELFYPKIQSDRLKYAIESFDILSALGLTVEEIGKIVRLTHPKDWDPASKKFTNIEAIIKAKMTDKGINEKMLSKLVEADWLERSIDRQHAKQIAQEELKKLSIRNSL